MDQEQTHTDFPRLWVAVILIVWAVGLNQSTILTREKTTATDRFHDIPTYEPAREILLDEIAADYLTDYRKKNKTVDRFWRAQYATVPTVLQIQFNANQADGSARVALEQGRRYYRILEFRDQATLLDTRRRLGQISKENDAFIEEHRVTNRIVVFSIRRAAND